MKVVIIVLNWNGEKYISKCLTSLQKLKKDNHTVETVVVDNASTDNSLALIKKKYPKFTLLQNSQNLGYAEGNNIGLRYALKNKFDFVWIINPDAYVHPNSLLQLISASQAHPQGGIFGSKIYFAPGFEFHKERYSRAQLGKVIWYAGGKIDWNNLISKHVGINEVDIGQYNTITETEFVTGASMFIRIQILDQIGLFDPKYFLYYEENDLCQRARRKKWKLFYIPDSIVWHANAQSTGVGSPLVEYYTTRNRLLFGFRYAPRHTRLALVRESFRHLITGRNWQRLGALDFYLGRFDKTRYVFSSNHH